MNEIIGKNIILRPVNIGDAKFILDLRTSKKGQKSLSPTENNLEKQIDWIAKYKSREQAKQEFYFVIQHKIAGDIGLVRLYDFNEKSFSWGSWIIKEGAPYSAAMESLMMVYDFGFYELGFSNTHFAAYKSNEKIVNFYTRFGATIVKSDDKNFFFEMSLNSYENFKNRLGKNFKK